MGTAKRPFPPSLGVFSSAFLAGGRKKSDQELGTTVRLHSAFTLHYSALHLLTANMTP